MSARIPLRVTRGCCISLAYIGRLLCYFVALWFVFAITPLHSPRWRLYVTSYVRILFLASFPIDLVFLPLLRYFFLLGFV